MRGLILGILLVGVCTPASAQFGVLDRGLKKVQEAQDAKKKFDDFTVLEPEELKIGQAVSLKIRQRFGVQQDAAVHRYVTLVGTLLAKQSERPELPWTFVVLDTDGVNAFAAPGGIVHITRGALGLINNEAELAAVLAHEIGHVAHRHTVNAIRKNNAVTVGANETLADRSAFLDKIANKAYEMVLENSFDRGDELDADSVSAQLTQKVGYVPGSLADFLTRLDERNKDQPAKNGLFASHPETTERIEKVRKAAGSKTGVLVESRYTMNVHYEATPITQIAAVADGAAGLTGSTTSTDDKTTSTDDKKKAEEQPKKKGFGLGSLRQAIAPEKQSTQVTASGGSRGVGADRAAKGGGNPELVRVTVSGDELTAFKNGIA
jgi:predicted Zn-dependent protease